KDSINDFVVNGKSDTINPAATGTKAAAHYRFMVDPGKSTTIRLRLTHICETTEGGQPAEPTRRYREKREAVEQSKTRSTTKSSPRDDPFADFDATFTMRKLEADEFYGALAPKSLSDDHKAIQRQAIAGMLW